MAFPIPKLKVGLTPVFPATVNGTNGISVTKLGGVFTISWNVGGFGQISNIADTVNTLFPLYNRASHTSNAIAWADLVAVIGAANAVNAGSVRATLVGANFNSTADQALVIPLPAGTTRYRILSVLASNPSTPLTAAVGGIYTGAGKTGTVVVPAATAYSALTSSVAGANGSLASLTVTNGSSAFFTAATLFLSLTTAQGGPATADVTIEIQPLN